jgi:hypothetical protein
MPADKPTAADYEKTPGLLDLAMRLVLGEQSVFEVRDKGAIEFFRELAKRQPP